MQQLLLNVIDLLVYIFEINLSFKCYGLCEIVDVLLRFLLVIKELILMYATLNEVLWRLKLLKADQTVTKMYNEGKFGIIASIFVKECWFLDEVIIAWEAILKEFL